MPRRALDARAFAEAISEALRLELSATHRAAKTLMSWTGASERTAKHWMAGTVGPSGPHLLELMRNSDAVLRVVLELAGRDRLMPAAALLAMRPGLRDLVALIEGLAPAGVEIHVPCAVAAWRPQLCSIANRRICCGD